ncbi:MAG: FMN-binding protein [Bacteroidota bacterium]
MVLIKFLYKAGIVALVYFSVFVSTAFTREPYTLSKKELKAIRDYLCENPITKPLPIRENTLSNAEFVRPKDQVFRIYNGEHPAGYILSTSAKGRYDYFDYCIVYSNELEIKGIVVIVYRSTHGAAISQRKWLSQFTGYKGGTLQVGANIDALSGATISAHSITTDIQRCQQLIGQSLNKK